MLGVLGEEIELTGKKEAVSDNAIELINIDHGGVAIWAS